MILPLLYIVPLVRAVKGYDHSQPFTELVKNIDSMFPELGTQQGLQDGPDLPNLPQNWEIVIIEAKRLHKSGKPRNPDGTHSTDAFDVDVLSGHIYQLLAQCMVALVSCAISSL